MAVHALPVWLRQMHVLGICGKREQRQCSGLLFFLLLEIERFLHSFSAEKIVPSPTMLRNFKMIASL